MKYIIATESTENTENWVGRGRLETAFCSRGQNLPASELAAPVLNPACGDFAAVGQPYNGPAEAGMTN